MGKHIVTAHANHQESRGGNIAEKRQIGQRQCRVALVEGINSGSDDTQTETNRRAIVRTGNDAKVHFLCRVILIGSGKIVGYLSEKVFLDSHRIACHRISRQHHAVSQHLQLQRIRFHDLCIIRSFGLHSKSRRSTNSNPTSN